MKQKKQLSPCAEAEDDILEFLAARPRHLKSIAVHLGVPPKNLNTLRACLSDLKARGKLRTYEGNRWGLASPQTTFQADITILPSGSGRVQGEDHTEIRIPAAHCGGAWNGDSVLVERLWSGKEVVGRVVKVVKRTEADQLAICVGKIGRNLLFRPVGAGEGHFFLAPPPPRQSVTTDELILLKAGKELKGRHKGRKLWSGSFIRSFGPVYSVSAQEAIVKHQRGVPHSFPALALEQAQKLPMGVVSADLKDREDLRHIPFVTIDGAAARDFDDAIQVERTPSGFLLRVAIADVSHYVPPDHTPGSLDEEARRRGNSWYFPTSVEPMLPEALSNGLCSLRPGEDRLALLAELPFSDVGLPLTPRFASVVIRSAARLTYDEVASFFADSPDAAPPNVAPMLRDARILYQLLAQRRRERGTIDFTIPDPTYEFDAHGEPVAMKDATRNDAHMLIEEFMIAANEAVATFLGQLAAPFLYRVHPAPDLERLSHLFDTLRLTALETLPPGLQKSGSDAAAIRSVLAKAQDTPQQYLVNRLCLRSMQQARYQAENVGHFGLASAAYCHFTSPIRRYADLTVHRALKNALRMENASVLTREELDTLGNSLNEQERKAVECERDMARRMACLLLSDHVGETRDGVVSGVTDFGLFVEFLDRPADGLIRIADLGQEWLELDQRRQCLVGRDSGKIWRLGQKLTVRIARVDPDRLEITLLPASSGKAAPPVHTGRAPRDPHGKRKRRRRC